MGACGIGGTYYSTHWKNGIGVCFRYDRKNNNKMTFAGFTEGGIEAIQKQARQQYGDDEYNGSASTCSFRYLGSWEREKNIDACIEKEMERIGKWEGCVVKARDYGYLICTTDIKETEFVNFDARAYLKKAKNGPAVLLQDLGDGRLHIINENTVAHLKRYVNVLMRAEQYQKNYYIVSRTKVYSCTYNAKFQLKTTRRSDDKVLIVPVSEFRYFGWAAE